MIRPFLNSARAWTGDSCKACVLLFQTKKKKERENVKSVKQDLLLVIP